jgi:integrase
MDLGSIVDYVSSSGDRRRYAVMKVLRLVEAVCGFGAEEVFGRVLGGELDPYKLLREVAVSLQREGLAPKTVRFYVSLLVRLLRMAGAEVRSELIRYRVPLPQSRAVRTDRAPTVEELRRLLAVMGARNRTLFLMLASTGMRLGECLQLRLGDVRLNAEPPYVEVRTAKSGVLRRLFLTRECVEALKAHLGRRVEEEPATSWLWPRRGNPSLPLQKRHAQQYWYAALKKVGLDVRDSSGLGYQLHIHSLRKFFRTQLERAGVSRTVISFWMGHMTGLDLSYFRPSEPQLMEEWRKAEPYLTLAEAKDVERIRKDIVLETIRRIAESFGVDPSRVRIEKQRQLGRDLTAEEEIQLLQGEMKRVREGNCDPRKIVTEKSLPKFLAEGWDVQTVLPSGKILIRKKTSP